MNIFIVGGTGFISKRIVLILLHEGHHVTVFTRGKTPILFQSSKNLQIKTGDRKKTNDLSNAIGNQTYDVIYDMIAYAPEQTQLVVESIKGKTGRFIHCSTISVYMISNMIQCPVTEDQDNMPVMDFCDSNPFGMDYGIKKRGCEKILWQHHDAQNFPVTILRPTYVCGPGDPTLRDYFWIERILDGRPLLVPGSGDFAFQQVYVEDVARAFVAMLNSPDSIGEAYNVAAEEIFSLNEYIEALGILLHCKPEMIHVDQQRFDQQSFSRNPRGDVFPYNTRRTAIFSLDKIKQDLNYKSTPFNTWMPLTINWYLNQFKGHSIGYERRDAEITFISNCKRHNIYTS
jgi:nucleoside-diphosphate-sugar epimerase